MSEDRSLDEFATGGHEGRDSSPADADGDPASTAVERDSEADDAKSEDSQIDDGESEDTQTDDVRSEDAEVDATETDDEVDRLAVGPAESTYAWSPSGAICADCGVTVERRWRDEGDLVCADCKSW